MIYDFMLIRWISGFVKIVLVAFFVTGLLSCGETDVIGMETDKDALPGGSETAVKEIDFKVDEFDDLPECTSKRENAVAYVEYEGEFYICKKAQWEFRDPVNLGFYVENTTDEMVNSSSGISSFSEPQSSESSSSTGSSSSSENLQLDAFVGLDYATECPKDLSCLYAPTSQLNPKIAYGEMLDTRDYQVYKTVTIGDQTWLAQNLNYIVEGSMPNRCYGGDEKNCKTYGSFYTWEMAQTACPEGWHLPSFDEYQVLFKYVDASYNVAATPQMTSSNVAGLGLRADRGNAIGFSGLPAGGYNANDGFFTRLDEYGFFWTSTEESRTSAYGMYLGDGGYADLNSANKADTRSVRCLKGAASSSSSLNLSSSSYQNILSETCRNEAIPYTMECPEEHECTYVQTGMLNANIDYGEFLDTRDYQMYKTVKVAGQTWLAQNLNYNYSYVDEGITVNSYCGGVDDSEGDCSLYGRLYSWTAALKVCPPGTHLPSSSEWVAVLSSLRTTENWWGDFRFDGVGTSIMACTDWKGGGGTDVVGLSFIASGLRNPDGSYSRKSEHSEHWTSTEVDAQNAQSMYLYYAHDYAGIDPNNKKKMNSVRCIVD